MAGAAKARGDAGGDLSVRLQLPVLSASSETQEGIEAVRERMNAAASAGDGAAKLFPQFNSNVPMTYEKVRVLLDALPLIVRGVLGYTFDRTERLIDDVEDRRYAALGDDALPRDEETRHLINPMERFGLGIDRTDFLHLEVGAEAPIELPKDTVLAPLLEYRWNVPVNRQGYVCAAVDEPE